MHANQDSDFQRVDIPGASAHDRAIHRVAEAVHRLNEAVQRAVTEGLSVELVRVSRFHSGQGAWGDQVVPTIRAPSTDNAGDDKAGSDKA